MSEEVLVKEEKGIDRPCGKCGADVRPGSAHCYNCGEKVDDLKVEALSNSNAGRNPGDARNGSAQAKPRSRRIINQPKTVEVMWKRSNGPGYAFILIALGIAVMVAVMLGAAYYLK